MTGRADVVRLESAVGSGTGFLISRDRLVTACHVILDLDTDELPQPVVCEFADGTRLEAGDIVAHDHAEDWAVLALEAPASARILPLHRTKLGIEGAAWATFGFPATHGSEGLALSGMVTSADVPRAARHGVHVIDDSLQLYCEQAAASEPQSLPGFSGSPVLVHGRVVGLIREFRGEVALGGTVDATRISAVLAGLAAVGKPFGLLAELREHHLPAFDSIAIFGEVDEQERLVGSEVAYAALRRHLDGEARTSIVARELWNRLPEPPRRRDQLTQLFIDPSSAHRQRCIPTSNLDILLARIGLVDDRRPLSGLFAAVRARSGEASDWRGRPLDLDAIHELKFASVDGVHTLGELARTAGPGSSWTIEGRPGAGKSVLLRRLHHILSTQVPSRGPSIFIEARRCRGRTLIAAISAEWPEYAPELERLLAGHEAASEVWLLIDGLDELPAADRRALLAQARHWAGPCVIATRRLPEPDRKDRRLVVEDLSSVYADSLLEQAGATPAVRELARQIRPSWHRGPRHVLQHVIESLLSTPLGVSMLACADGANIESRATLIQGLMSQELDRAVEAGRIVEAIRARFQRHGYDFLGVVAWNMIREQRTTLTSDDFVWAEAQLGLSPATVDELQCAMESLGFVDLVGPEQWEFSHKVFAEHCAARAIARGKVEWEPLLAALGEPGINEVTIHLGARPEFSTRVIARLLAERDRPFTALRLATAVAAEALPNSTDPAVLAELVKRQAAIATRLLPDQALNDPQLPGGAGSFDDLELVLTRHAAALTPHRVSIAEACAEPVRDWLLGHPRATRPEFADRDFSRQCAKLAALGFEIALPRWFELPDAEQHLFARGRGEWARALVPIWQHEDPYTAHRARRLWVECAPREDLLAECSKLGQWDHDGRTILAAVAELGSLRQAREALLRTQTSLLPVAETLGFVDMDTLWRAAWDAGLLGRSWSYAHDEIRALYRRFLADAHNLARHRALRAHVSDIGSRTPELPVTQLKELARDQCRRVRIEAIAQLGDRQCASYDALAHSLATPDDEERHVAWAAWLASGATPEFSTVLTATCPWTTPRPRASYEAVELPADQDTRGRVEGAERTVGRWLAERLEDHDLGDVCRALVHPYAKVLAAAVLQSLPQERRASLLEVGPAVIRRHLARDSMYSVEAALLERLAGDTDPVIAAAAARTAARAGSLQQFEPVTPAIAPLVAPDEDGVFSIGVLHSADAALRAPVVDVQQLLGTTDFATLWTMLGTHAIRWSTFQDTDGYVESKDWDAELDQLMQEAGDMNRRAVLPLLSHLRKCYRPRFRSELVTTLHEPQRGYFAMGLLGAEGPAADLVEVIDRDLRTAVRAARLLVGSEFADDAARRFVDRLVTGRLEVEVPESNERLRWPSRTLLYFGRGQQWMGLLLELGGVEAVILLAQSTSGGLRDYAVECIAAAVWCRPRRITPTARDTLRTFARAVNEHDNVVCRVAALQTLVDLGDNHDAATWLPRVRAMELPMPVWETALVLLGAHGDASARELLVDVVETTNDVHARDAALLGLSFVKDQPALAERALEWLRRPLGLPNSRMSHYGDGWERLVGRIVVNAGDRTQAERFALSALDECWVMDVLEAQLQADSPRIFPEHGLLVLGAVRQADYHNDDGYPEEPLQARLLLDQLCRYVERSEVRRCFVRVLATTDAIGWSEERDLLDPLGGILPEDSGLFLAMLEREPLDRRLLACLAKCSGAGEAELAAIWGRAVSWWSPSDPQ